MASKTAPGDEYHNPLGNPPTYIGDPDFEPGQRELVATVFGALDRAAIPFLLAGGFAKHAYTGIWRNTKDVDLFLKPADVGPALEALAAAGLETELRDPLWLAKTWREPYLVDLISGAGNGVLPIDDSWIRRARPYEMCGIPCRLIALEDLIASKLYIAFRDRFDGADVAHLLRCRGAEVHWERVLELLGDQRQLLLWHLVYFDYVYPGHSDLLPRALMTLLFDEMRSAWEDAYAVRQLRGPLLDDSAFAIDVLDWGYEDPRPSDARRIPR
jgi:hypothetical protein